MVPEEEKTEETKAEASAESVPAVEPVTEPVVVHDLTSVAALATSTEDVTKDNDSEVTIQKAYEQKDRMMRNFRYAHLPVRLQDVSLRFATVARWIVDNIPSSAERTVALRKLLESKDCAVRARLEADEAAAG